MLGLSVNKYSLPNFTFIQFIVSQKFVGLPLGFLLLQFAFSCESSNKTGKTGKKSNTIEVVNSVDTTSRKIPVKQTQDFVPEGYLIQKEIFGDLNGDGFADCALILEKENGKSDLRSVRILLHDDETKWKNFETAWDLISNEYNEEYKRNESEDYSIKEGELVLETFCYGPCGNDFLHFAFEKDLFILTYYSYYFAGAGSHSFLEYERKNNRVSYDVTNTMLDDMPTETEEIIFNKRIRFESLSLEKVQNTF